MIDTYPRGLTLVAVVATGLVGGVFFAFSTFVMSAIRALPDKEGLEAMQAVNKAAPTPIFMLALLGTAVLVIGMAIYSLMHRDLATSKFQIAGAACYLVAILMTMIYHVPHNDALAVVDPNSAGAITAWRNYAGPWVLLNHVRTLGSLAAAVMFALALRAEA